MSFAPGVEEQVADDVKPEGIKVNEMLRPLVAVAELEAATAEAERLRGELTAANACHVRRVLDIG